MGNYKFDLDYRNGELAEQEINKILKDPTIEVKEDSMSYRTGNAAIEFECRGKPSGIATTEATWWAIWLKIENRIVLIKTDTLKELVKGCPTTIGGDPGSNTRMYLVPKEKLVNL